MILKGDIRKIIIILLLPVCALPTLCSYYQVTFTDLSSRQTGDSWGKAPAILSEAEVSVTKDRLALEGRSAEDTLKELSDLLTFRGHHFGMRCFKYI